MAFEATGFEPTNPWLKIKQNKSFYGDEKQKWGRRYIISKSIDRDKGGRESGTEIKSR